MSYRPVNELFSSGLLRSRQACRSMEDQRRFSSYIIAAMLALPLGLLPFTVSALLSRFQQAAVPGATGLTLFGSGLSSLFMAASVVLVLAFIVAMNIRADLVFEHSYKQARQFLADSSVALRILDSQFAASVDEQINRRMLPEVLGVSTGRDLLAAIDHFAHYHRYYFAKSSEALPAVRWMAWRQTATYNFLLSFLVSLLCLLLAGYFFLPLLLTRLFVRWPELSAYRLAFVEFLHGMESTDSGLPGYKKTLD